MSSMHRKSLVATAAIFCCRFTGLLREMTYTALFGATGALDAFLTAFRLPVASRAGYSPSYFSRIFKEEMGMTFKESLNEMRVERSKTLLLTTTEPVSTIASIAGFNDQSYFCKTFRRSTGVTPDKFRKRVRRIDAEKEYGLK